MESQTKAAAAFQAGVHLYGTIGTPLYAALCAAGADDPEILELASYGMGGAPPMHLFSSVHYLLLRDSGDPLSRYFATLTAEPSPPEQAFPDFKRYCLKHRAEIVDLLQTRTVQTTYAERSGVVMAALSAVADEAGEPLNLVELGCSAGVLLTFDKYGYDLGDRGRLGPPDAPFTLTPTVEGGPPLRIPRIGTRTGLDLHVIDAKSEEDRRWLLALCFPEFREQQGRLAKALDVVAQTDIRMIEGDALASLPAVLADTPDPLCVFHSACLLYWPAEAKAALEELLVGASKDRTIYRVGIEASENFDSWKTGRTDGSEQPKGLPKIAGEVIITRYQGGSADRRVVANNIGNYGHIQWIERGGDQEGTKTI